MAYSDGTPPYVEADEEAPESKVSGATSPETCVGDSASTVTGVLGIPSGDTSYSGDD